jgi:hypothetical protein
MIKNAAFAIIMCIVPMCCIAQKVFSDGKEIAGYDYVNIEQTTRVVPGTYEVIFYYTFSPPFERTKIDPKTAAAKFLEIMESGRLRDSSGKALDIGRAVELMIVMSKAGYDYVEREVPPNNMTNLGGKIGHCTTAVYLFKRRRQ